MMKNNLIFSFIMIMSIPSYALDFKAGLSDLKEHPILSSSKTDMEIATKSISLLRGNLLPQVDFKAGYSKFEKPQGTMGDEQRMYSLSLSQPLFRGGQEFKALDQAKLKERASKLIYHSTWIDFASTYTNTYFNLLTNLKSQKLENELILLSSERERELSKRVKIGRSRNADLLTARGQTLRAKQVLSNLENNEKILKRNLSYIVSSEAITSPDEILVPKKKLSFNDLRDKLDTHPLLQAKILELEIAKKEIGIADGGHLPSIDLNGNYYLERYGMSQDQHWDVSLNLTLPLYSGGKTSAESNIASLKLRKVLFELKNSKEELSLKLKELISDFNSSLGELELATLASKLDGENYKEYKKDFELGLLTSLEVSSALDRKISSDLEVARLSSEVQKLYALTHIFLGEYFERN